VDKIKIKPGRFKHLSINHKLLRNFVIVQSFFKDDLTSFELQELITTPNEIHKQDWRVFQPHRLRNKRQLFYQEEQGCGITIEVLQNYFVRIMICEQ
jgi:hypothetical protein